MPTPTNFEISPISADETLGLRGAILRPKTPREQLSYPGDADDSTLHVGAFAEGEMCGISSIFVEAPPWDDSLERSWRLRGVATTEEFRRRGVGRWMIATCMQHAFENTGQLVWCNARIIAVPFYDRLGFEIHGDRFEIPEIGPHYVMWLNLQ